MAQQTINVGTAPNDGTGTPLRTAFQYTNSNFSELYTAVGPSGNNIVVPGNATITGDLTVDTSTLYVSSSTDKVGIGTTSLSNEKLTIAGNISANAWLGRSNISVPAGDCSIFRSADNTLGFGIASTTAMTLNANGLGIGVTPSAWNSSYRCLQLGSGGAISAHTSASLPWLVATSNSFINSAGDWKFINNGYSTRYLARGDDGTQSWWTSNNGSAGGTVAYTQAMTLDASGRLLVGVTSAIASGNTFQNLGSARQVLTLKGDDQTSYTLGVWSASATGDNLFQYFGTEATLTVRGSISYNRAGGLVAYNTTSDYRAKDIIGPVSNSGSLIDSLKVYVGKMKGATIERPMLIAHEAQEVAPYAVTGTKDEVDSDGKPKYQQMDASALVPLLIAEIQSLRARVQTLETR